MAVTSVTATSAYADEQKLVPPRIAAIATTIIVFFTRKIVPLPFYATIIATATGLAFGNVFFTWLLTKEMKKDMEAAAQQKADSEGGE